MNATVNTQQSAETKKTRLSTRDLLLQLPDVFSVAEFALVTGRLRTEASQYLWRFSQNGLVKGIGGKSGVFINAVANPNATSDGGIWERAILKAMPSAMIGGYETLAESGISTQVTHQRYILISNNDAMFEIEGAEIHRRPVPWMKKLFATNAVVNESPGAAIPRLKPGAALADLALYGDALLDPDDLDLDFVDPTEITLFRLSAQRSELASVLLKTEFHKAKKTSRRP